MGRRLVSVSFVRNNLIPSGSIIGCLVECPLYFLSWLASLNLFLAHTVVFTLAFALPCLLLSTCCFESFCAVVGEHYHVGRTIYKTQLVDRLGRAYPFWEALSDRLETITFLLKRGLGLRVTLQLVCLNELCC